MRNDQGKATCQEYTLISDRDQMHHGNSLSNLTLGIWDRENIKIFCYEKWSTESIGKTKTNTTHLTERAQVQPLVALAQQLIDTTKAQAILLKLETRLKICTWTHQELIDATTQSANSTATSS